MSWSIIPKPKATGPEQLAEQTAVCWRATSIVDTYCNQVLRATVDAEELSGPGGTRVAIQRDTGNGILVMRRWPVSQVLAVQIARNSGFPRAWTTVPAGQYEVAHPLINQYSDSASATTPDGGSSILLAPGYVTHDYGRNGFRLLVSYTNGWPHTSMTATANAGAATLQVDDVTGFVGASAFVYDGASTEPVSVTAVSAATPMQLPNGAGTAQTGPGTVTLSAPLANAHAAGVVVSALPANVLWATVLAAATQALESGITSVSIQNIPGSQTVGGHGVSDMQMQYQCLLDPYRRVM
ncbi:hypothetical protein ABT186_02130 [Streptomyces sp. NPDC001634]|uniref:hypothetical protein n=1 Tax=Streptomyces sp. NPDC001634 TaxID=3154390 RepID=UPI00331B575B